MLIFFIGISVVALSGFLSLFISRSAKVSNIIGSVGIAVGSAVALVPPIQTIANGQVHMISMPWRVPFASFTFVIDSLSAFFLIPILILSIVCSLYGMEYLRPHLFKKNINVTWFFTAVLIVSMTLVVTASNAVLFLVVWEVMALSSFFLVMFETENEQVRRAGYIYLVASHIGTVLLIFMFILLGNGGNNILNFDSFGGHSAVRANIIFVLAVIGFGTKAGFIPVHVWLPEAHPAAPSHISALMSGVMIKVGIYGILRTLTFLGTPQEWWGWTLLCIGLGSGVLGVLFALAQHDIKRLLAYHSVENIGIIAAGIGIGMIGISAKSVPLIVLGFAGGLLHVVNHAVFKGLLFLGAGSVAHATGTRNIEKLGGLGKKLPVTSTVFLIGSIAICAIPPLNGFISEFLIYSGAIYGVTSGSQSQILAGILTVVSFALIGGLAVACFTKAFGVIFLGERREHEKEDVHESGIMMKLPMIFLAIACFIIGLLSPFVIGLTAPVIMQISRVDANSVSLQLNSVSNSLGYFIILSSILFALIAILFLFRRLLGSGREAHMTETWGCGYAQPTARMQYTATSYAHPIVSFFRMILRPHKEIKKPEGIFPAESSLSTETKDTFLERVFVPFFKKCEWFFYQFRRLQHGELHRYILYIVITLFALLLFALG